MASPLVVLKVPADYVGYIAMKFFLQELVRQAGEHPYDATWQDVGDVARRALEWVAETEREP